MMNYRRDDFFSGITNYKGYGSDQRGHDLLSLAYCKTMAWPGSRLTWACIPTTGLDGQFQQTFRCSNSSWERAVYSSCTICGWPRALEVQEVLLKQIKARKTNDLVVQDEVRKMEELPLVECHQNLLVRQH